MGLTMQSFILRQAQLSLCSVLLELLLFSLDAPRTRSVTTNSHATLLSLRRKFCHFLKKNMFNYTKYCLRITGTGCNLDLKSWIKFYSRETILRILLQHPIGLQENQLLHRSQFISEAADVLESKHGFHVKTIVPKSLRFKGRRPTGVRKFE